MAEIILMCYDHIAVGFMGRREEQYVQKWKIQKRIPLYPTSFGHLSQLNLTLCDLFHHSSGLANPRPLWAYILSFLAQYWSLCQVGSLYSRTRNFVVLSSLGHLLLQGLCSCPATGQTGLLTCINSHAHT